MRNSDWIKGCLWALLFWTLFFFVVTAPNEDFPSCSTYEEC